jgi:hypothetical protein
MARTVVTVTTLTANAGTTEPAGTTADPTNDHSIDPGGPTDLLLIRLANTNGTDRVATVVAGDSPPALNTGQGDLAITVPATTGVKWVGPLESARFIQSDGLIHVDLAASFAGTVTAYKVPRTA